MTSAPYLASEFLEIAASTPKPQVVIWTHCEKCMDRTDFVLVKVENHNGEIEIYECKNCKTRKSYKVT